MTVARRTLGPASANLQGRKSREGIRRSARRPDEAFEEARADHASCRAKHCGVSRGCRSARHTGRGPNRLDGVERRPRLSRHRYLATLDARKCMNPQSGWCACRRYAGSSNVLRCDPDRRQLSEDRTRGRRFKSFAPTKKPRKKCGPFLLVLAPSSCRYRPAPIRRTGRSRFRSMTSPRQPCRSDWLNDSACGGGACARSGRTQSYWKARTRLPAQSS
jgi:hypothetical protein